MIQVVLPHGSKLQVFLKGWNGLVGQELSSASYSACACVSSQQSELFELARKFS